MFWWKLNHVAQNSGLKLIFLGLQGSLENVVVNGKEWADSRFVKREGLVSELVKRGSWMASNKALK